MLVVEVSVSLFFVIDLLTVNDGVFNIVFVVLGLLTSIL